MVTTRAIIVAIIIVIALGVAAAVMHRALTTTTTIASMYTPMGHTSTVSSVAATMSKTTTHQSDVVLKIFCAGSLYIPFKKVAEEFTKRYGVPVHIEPSGSVYAVRKVIDLGKRCDVIAVADYRLLPMYVYPNYSGWYIAFARNEIVIAFTENSRYADIVEKHPEKIFEILMRPDVRYGFSDPNQDPCGYRAVGVLALASMYYHNEDILRELVLDKIPGARVESKSGVLHIYVPPSFTPRGNLVVRPKSVDLIHLLEAGELDYAFEYKSVAIQHGLKYVELPPQINLADPQYDSFYRRVVVHILAGTPREKAISMSSIVYGLTIPVNAPHPDLAIKFVELLLSDIGRRIFEECGQPFLPKVLGWGAIPDELKRLIQVVG